MSHEIDHQVPSFTIISHHQLLINKCQALRGLLLALGWADATGLTAIPWRCAILVLLAQGGHGFRKRAGTAARMQCGDMCGWALVVHSYTQRSRPRTN